MAAFPIPIPINPAHLSRRPHRRERAFPEFREELELVQNHGNTRGRGAGETRRAHAAETRLADLQEFSVSLGRWEEHEKREERTEKSRWIFFLHASDVAPPTRSSSRSARAQSETEVANDGFAPSLAQRAAARERRFASARRRGASFRVPALPSHRHFRALGARP